MISLTLPLRTVSESNAREHWSARHRRRGNIRCVVRMALCGPVARVAPDASTCLVRVTRVSPGRLDFDNLVSSQKATIDGIADALGINDRDLDGRVEYRQERGKPREYAVRIEIGIAAP